MADLYYSLFIVAFFYFSRINWAEDQSSVDAVALFQVSYKTRRFWGVPRPLANNGVRVTRSAEMLPRRSHVGRM